MILENFDLKDFVISLILGVIAHTFIGAIKHRKAKDFNWKELFDGGINFSLYIFGVILIFCGLNYFEPLQTKFSNEFMVLMEYIVYRVYKKDYELIKEYGNIKDEDIKEYIDTRNYGELNEDRK